MRLYRNLVAAAATALQQIFEQDELADRLVPRLLRSNKQWGSKDRRFLAETIYEIVRWYRLYHEILGHVPQTEDDWWRMVGLHWSLQGIALPDWSVLEGLDAQTLQARYTALQAHRAIGQSIPDWLDALGQATLGAQWAPCLAASNQPAEVYLRANPLKATRAKVLAALQEQGIEAEALADAPQGIRVLSRAQLTSLRAYQQGWFEVQDAASQQVAPYLGAQPGMQVVDACAGAGGKSLHLAALMANQGRLTALEVSARKLRELSQRARRAGVSIVRTQVVEELHTVQPLYDTADRLLLDVPCSGLGTLRRSPQIKWRLQPDFLTQIQATQAAILDAYSPMCKRGGRLVYATCSILPQENQDQVAAFLARPAGAGFRLVQAQTLLPQDGSDGFYMALLERVE